ncbi:hypothetical protein ABZT02_33900 [Streptomyces sp. NPDC005402]|uniref:hypothetical protein n=1 Tax=Streptomyces sp. NPDC005402 TaxID=3155338 RepID=UPI0033AF566A
MKLLKPGSNSERFRHPWVMPLPAIAILVSAASAMFTLTNMLISAASYRRGGPRLKLSVRLRAHNPEELLKEADPTKWRTYLHVHVRNRSSASVEVDEVQVVPRYLGLIRLGYRFSIVDGLPMLLRNSRVKFVVGEDRKNIAPFGGARWVLDDELTVSSRPGKWRARLLMFRVRVTLSNGQEINSRLMSYWAAKRANAFLFANLESARKFHERRKANLASSAPDGEAAAES